MKITNICILNLFECEFSPLPPLKCGSFVCISTYTTAVTHAYHLLCAFGQPTIILGCIRQLNEITIEPRALVQCAAFSLHAVAWYKRIKSECHNAMFYDLNALLNPIENACSNLPTTFDCAANFVHVFWRNALALVQNIGYAMHANLRHNKQSSYNCIRFNKFIFF